MRLAALPLSLHQFTVPLDLRIATELTRKRMALQSPDRGEVALNALRVGARFCDQKLGWNRIGFLLSITIIAIAAVVLYRILRNIDVQEVIDTLMTSNP